MGDGGWGGRSRPALVNGHFDFIPSVQSSAFSPLFEFERYCSLTIDIGIISMQLPQSIGFTSS